MRFALHRFARGAADWRSGPRWSILSVLCPVHPFATTWHFPSRENEKIGGTGYCVTYDTDSQSRNVLASPLGEEGHEVAKGWTVVRMIMRYSYSMSYRPLKGKRLTTFCASLALLLSLLSLTHWIFRSHSAKCVRCASLRLGGRRLAVRTAMEHPIGTLPRTPFCLFEAFPLKGKRENRWHWILCHI